MLCWSSSIKTQVSDGFRMLPSLWYVLYRGDGSQVTLPKRLAHGITADPESTADYMYQENPGRKCQRHNDKHSRYLHKGTFVPHLTAPCWCCSEGWTCFHRTNWCSQRATVPGSLPLAYIFAVLSLLSPAYMIQPSVSCLVQFIQLAAQALCFALFKAGNNMAARIAIIAMTTNNSIKVKPRGKDGNNIAVRRDGWCFIFEAYSPIL